MIKVNLIGDDTKRDFGGYAQVLIGLFVLVALFSVISALYIIQDKKLNSINSRIAKAEKRIKELEAVKKKVDDFKARNAELNRRIQIIKVLENNRTGPLYVMDALGKGIPKMAWIDEFTEKGLNAKLSGIADNEFTVADFMEALQKSPYFSGVELGVIKKTSLRNQSLRSFVITSRLDYTGKRGQKQADQKANAQNKPNQVKKTGAETKKPGNDKVKK
jgi:type IV pilus assembly protein PilN